VGRSHAARQLRHAEWQRQNRLAKGQRALRRALAKLVAEAPLTVSAWGMLLHWLAWFIGGAA
jgi:hypothetical protein